jgi:PAS domain S-box-containing protein
MQNDSKEFSSNLAQRRVRWLSVVGVGSGSLLFCIATILLVWTNSIRDNASRVEDMLVECRLSVSRALINIHHDWDRLITESPNRSDIEQWPVTPTWKDDLESAVAKCEELNAFPSFCDNELQVAVSGEPLLTCYGKVIDWHSRNRKLVELTRSRLSAVEKLLQGSLFEIDRQQGKNRLRFAVALRQSQAVGQSNVDEVFANLTHDSLLSRLRSDVTELRLQLFQFVSSKDYDELVNMSENEIRPLINRLNSEIEDERLAGVFHQVTRLIFHPCDANDPHSIVEGGLSELQMAFAENLEQRKALLEQATQAATKLSIQHGNLAILNGALQNSLNSRLTQALAIVWSIVLTTGLGVSTVFLLLTRRVSHDIALQVEAIELSAQELAHEQSLLATVISSLPNPLFWKDKDGRYLGCSQSFAKWMGIHTASDIIGKTDLDLPWSKETAEEKNKVEIGVIKTARSFNAEITKNLQDGRQCVVLASKAPLYNADGEVDGILGAYIDITERKVMEERAIGLANIMAECPTEIYAFDTDRLRLIELNRAACKSSGFNCDFYRSYSFADINQLLNAETLNSTFMQLLDGSRKQLDYETLHRRCDGSAYPVHVSVMSTELEGQRVYVACATDLTEYKQLEVKLAQSQKLESIGQLAAGIAHEINTPMQCISGNIEFLENCSSKLLDVVDALNVQMNSTPEEWGQRISSLKQLMLENRYDYVRQQVPLAITESAQAAARVIQIVRAMKVMSHPGTREKVTTDLNGLIRDAVTISRNRWKYAAEIDFQLDSTLPTIEALPAELSQVLLNLLVNAADAIVEKNGENEADKGHITIRTSYDESNIYLAVSDNGIGMPDYIKKRVFEPFFTTKEVGKGTGQGLNIVYNVITKMHGGTIDINSVVGIGSTFSLQMPRVCVGPPSFETTPASVTVTATV